MLLVAFFSRLPFVELRYRAFSSEWVKAKGFQTSFRLKKMMRPSVGHRAPGRLKRGDLELVVVLNVK